MQEQTKVEYTFLTVDTEGEVLMQDGKYLERKGWINDFAAQGWRFVTMVRNDTDDHFPIFLMQREAAK